MDCTVTCPEDPGMDGPDIDETGIDVGNEETGREVAGMRALLILDNKKS